MGGGDQRERTNVEVRFVTPVDIDALTEFFTAVPEGDRTFFKEDVTQPSIVAGWVTSPGQYRLVALVNDVIVGYAAVLQGVEWSAHVGEVCIVVLPSYRNRSIGRLLAQRAVMEAKELGIAKLVVDVVAGRERLLAMFMSLGFEQEGRLRASSHAAARLAGERTDVTN